MTAKGAILVTGANRGLGLGLTREFLRRGWRVYAGCRIPEGATALRQLADEGGEELRIVALDLRSDTGVAAAMSEIARDAHGLDVLVNNAGINPGPRDCRIDEILLASVAEAMEVNLLGTLRVVQAALPLLRRTAHPRVVNISSGAGSLSRNASRWRQPPYCLSKAALNMLTRRAALDVPDVSFVSVSPGWIRTDMGGPEGELGVEEASSALAATIEVLAREHTGHWIDRFGRPSEFAW